MGNVCEQRWVNIYIGSQVSKDFLMVVCERADEVWELSKDMADGVSLHALQKALDDHHGLRDDMKHCEKNNPTENMRCPETFCSCDMFRQRSRCQFC